MAALDADEKHDPPEPRKIRPLRKRRPRRHQQSLGANQELGIIWGVADTLNGMMAIPNLIGLLLLSPVVFRLTTSYFASDNAR